MNTLIRNSGYFSPFNWSVRFATAFNKFNSALVSALFLWRGPSAVFRTVWSVIVDSVYRVTRGWGAPHIGEESLKRIAPLITHINSTAAIVFIVSGAFVCAAPNHQGPSIVFLGGFAAVWVGGIPVFYVYGVRYFALQATARLCMPAAQVVGHNDNHGSAFANAVPRSPFTNIYGSVNNSNTPEFISRKINEIWHFVTSKLITVIGAWQSAVNSFSGATLAKRVNFIGCAA